MKANRRLKAERRRRAQAAFWAIRQGTLTARQLAKFEVWAASEENRLALDMALSTLGQTRAVLASMATRAHTQTPMRKRVRRNKWLQFAAALAAIAIIGASVAALNWQPSQLAKVQVVATRQAVLTDYELPDRSVVNLRPGTRASFEMSDARRLVHLSEGEIFFDVMKDPQRPFIVNVGKSFIRAVGTRFAVRLYDGAPAVVVQEGTVAVERARGLELLVEAGQKLEIMRSGAVIVRPVDVKEELKWARKRVNVSGKTIGEVVQEFNRRNLVKIRIVDAEVAGEVLSLAEYYLDDPQFFVDSLVAQRKVVVERVGTEALHLSSSVMSFVDRTVAQIATEFNRRNKVQIKIDDVRLGSEVIPLGIFYLDDPEHFVAVLKTKRKVIVERPDPVTLRVSRGS